MEISKCNDKICLHHLVQVKQHLFCVNMSYDDTIKNKI